MARPIFEIKITREKINKDLLFKGRKGTYLDIACFPNADGKGEYGDDGYCVQKMSQEQREAGAKGPICGNWKYVEQPAAAARPAAKPAARPKPPVDPDLDAEDGEDRPF